VSVGVAAIATLFGVAGTGVARGVAIRLGILNQPNPIVPDHRSPIPYLGGIGLLLGAYLTIAVTVLVSGSTMDGAPLWLLVGGAAFLLVGLLDDLLTFSAARKLVLQFGAAALTILVGAPIPAVTGIAPLDIAFAAFWLVGVVNAVNVIDVCDGLAASVCLATFAAFAVALSPYALAAAALAGSCVGFLFWNRPSARIFMGDAGSHFLGFFVAALSLTASAPAGPWPFVAMLALFAGVPLFDLFFQSLTRAREGRAWYVGGPDSFALRLQEAGLSKAAVDVTAAGVALALWVCAYLLPGLTTLSQVVLSLGLLVTAALVWRSLLHWKVRLEPVAPAAATAPDRATAIPATGLDPISPAAATVSDR
jgi:UDP-GlcNAc:undecaprenyl-phosphate/decaprenyl-phosphate GlcNAc-1-phosphate transferase